MQKFFSDYYRKLIKVGSMEFLKETVEKALLESKEYVTEKLQSDMPKHHRTGRTESSIDTDSKVMWEGSVAYVKVGFNISSGGLASIFLMYGTPRMQPDRKLYNDVYGNGNQQEDFGNTKEVFDKALQEVMEGH